MNDDSTLSPKVLQLIASIAGKNPSSLQRQQHLTVDLGLDSPKALELLMALEDDFGMEITDEEAAKLETVGDILDLMTARRS